MRRKSTIMNHLFRKFTPKLFTYRFISVKDTSRRISMSEALQGAAPGTFRIADHLGVTAWCGAPATDTLHVARTEGILWENPLCPPARHSLGGGDGSCAQIRRLRVPVHP